MRRAWGLACADPLTAALTSPAIFPTLPQAHPVADSKNRFLFHPRFGPWKAESFVK